MTNRRERRAAGKAAKHEPVGADGSRLPVAAPSTPVSALLAEALALYQGGRLTAAEGAYRAILKHSPQDPDALYQFGVLAGQMGYLAETDRCLAEAAMLRPGEPAFHHALGLLRSNQGRFADALVCHSKALAVDPAHVGGLVGSADALHELGRLAEAEDTYRRAAAQAPHAPEVQFGWATVLADLGRLLDAERAYRQVLALSPRLAEARVNLGTVLKDLGQLNDAATQFQQALALKPDIAHALVGLVSALSALGRNSEAVEHARRAMQRDPRSAEARRGFAAAARAGALPPGAETAGFLEHCLRAEDVDHDDLATMCAGWFRQTHRIDPSPVATARNAVDSATAGRGIPPCLTDPLLLRLLGGAINTDLELELFLTEARRCLCLAPSLPAGLNPFVAALALQGFNNGYVFPVTSEEAARVAQLRADLAHELARTTAIGPALEQRLLRFALYEPLAALAPAQRLLEISIPQGSPMQVLVAHCLAEPLEEAALAREIPRLGMIENAVSQAVRDQYEEHPYPHWLSLPHLEPMSLATMLRRKLPHAPVPTFLEGPIEILVAGCGTGRQPIATALSVAGARVLAVDLSLRSLGYAQRMARRFGASNVEFLHADLLALAGLGRTFDVAEAVGVLHHMEDPMAGWRSLTRLLRADGVMRIGLYSAMGRAQVLAARERIAALGLAPTPGDIRAFRHRVLLGSERERLPGLAASKDIHDLNGCRDLLFHVRERRYTLPELGEMLQSLELEFLGFDHADERTGRRYRAEHPEDSAATDLARWAEFEVAHPDAFSGMYVFWCQKMTTRQRSEGTVNVRRGDA